MTGMPLTDLQREETKSGQREDTEAGLKVVKAGNVAQDYCTPGFVPGPQWLWGIRLKENYPGWKIRGIERNGEQRKWTVLNENLW
ncbi:uncharacterized protein LOC129135541 isoform X5 [Pan troglodytes]|uniref:uncharacterized protein LOC129135541 isoform X5 n=1 Tax=Pan troglodytes TaxID=9598 RepID=UPI0030133625